MAGARTTRWPAGLVAVASVILIGMWCRPVAAGGMDSGYRVLKPIQSGDLTLFPVVRGDGKTMPSDQFLTLDEGLKSGDVEVTEAGNVRGLVRSRGGAALPRYASDQVNTLVLVNNSKRPLLLLAGEIVTGGKQDRVIAKDRIVPAGADPIDLSVFCIEHGRWTGSSDKFGSTSKVAGESFMVQPTVREQAMVAKDQQQVWNSVNGAISSMAMAAAPGGGSVAGMRLGTTSYAKAMQTPAVSAKVDQDATGLAESREQVLATLREERAVGVVVAVRGEVIWADIFSDPGLLERYWTKLVRSYAAEELVSAKSRGAATMTDAQRFLDTPMHGTEESQGEVGVYRCSEVKAGGTDLFTLEALLPGTGYNVHISRLKLREAESGLRPAGLY